MAEQQLPSYVLSVNARGHRIYDPKFVEGLIADLNAGKITAQEAHEKFGVHPSQASRWKKIINKGGTYSSTRGSGSPNYGKNLVNIGYKPKGKKSEANGATGDLIELAKNYEAEQNPRDPNDQWDIDGKHVRLALLYLEGRITQSAVNYALRKSTGRGPKKIVTTTWLGQVFRWAIQNGYSLSK